MNWQGLSEFFQVVGVLASGAIATTLAYLLYSNLPKLRARLRTWLIAQGHAGLTASVALFRDRVASRLERPQKLGPLGSFSLKKDYFPVQLQQFPVDSTRLVYEDPVELLKRRRRLVILGPPGSGKTTLLRHLELASASEYSPQIPDTPVFISLNQYGLAKTGLVDFAVELMARRDGIYMHRDQFEQLLRDGLALLLLDGLDELGHRSSAYGQVLRQVREMSEQYPSSSFVLSCRTEAWSQSLEGFREMAMSPLQRAQIRGFIRRRFSDQEGACVEGLYDVIDSSPSLQELAESPFFLTLMIALIEKQRGRLPRTRLALYERCVALLMKEWDDLRGLRRPSTVTPRVKLQVLKGLGLELQAQHSTFITMKRLTALVEDLFPHEQYRVSAQDIAGELTAIHGLLISAEGPDGAEAYSFQHFTFQSYFAALQLEDTGWQDILKEVGHSWWREVIVLLAAMDHTDAIVEHIIAIAEKEQDENQRRSLIFLAADCASNGSASESSLAGLVSCLEEWLAGDDPRAAFEASTALARIGGSKVIDVLKKHLGSPSCLHTQAAAAAALSSVTDPSEEILDTLLDALRRGDQETRARAARALGNRGFTWAVDSLLSALSSPESREVRAEMLRALNSIVQAPRLDTSSLAMLFKTLKSLGDDPDPDVADLAQEILRKLSRSEMQ